MENQLLRNPEIFPSKDVLQDALGDLYGVFDFFMETIENDEHGLVSTWNYYKDGKAWLCKVCFRKKTVCWLSVWEGYFKVSFFFTEKHIEGINALDIDQEIKEDFVQSNSAGRLIPLIIDVCEDDQLAGILKIAEFKKTLK